MASPASRKSSRVKKTPLDLTNPKSKLAKCVDIKALVKEKIGKLSKDAQKELMALLPTCDQQHDELKTALDGNDTFWSSLGEWHQLLKLGELKPSRRTLSVRDLEAIPWKDENYERYWGEKMAKDKQSMEQDEQPPATTKRQAPTKRAPPTKRQPPPPTVAKTTQKKTETQAGPKVERRGRKKKVVVPPPPPPPSESIDLTSMDENDEPADQVKPVEEVKPADEVEPVEQVKPAEDAEIVVVDAEENQSKDEKPMMTEATTENPPPSIADKNSEETNPHFLRTTSPTPTKTTVRVPITIPVHAPATIVNKNRNSITNQVRLSTKFTIDDDANDFQEDPVPRKSNKRHRNTNTKKSPRNPDDDSDGEGRRKTRSRTASHEHK